MVHAVSFSILSSSDFAYLAVNDFSLSTSQLAMAMSTEVIGSISSLPRDSFTESFSFLPESSSVMSPFVSYVDNRIHTASSFASSTLDDALLYENGFSVSTSQHSMTMSMPFSHIHQIILTSTDEDLIQKLNATSVVKEYSELVVGHTVFKSAYRAMSTTYNHTATGSIAQSLAFITETFCEKTASLYKSSDLKETIIEVASSSKTLDVNYPVSNTMISYLETVYGLSSTNSFISNTKTDVEMSSSTALILPTALFNSQSLLIIGTFYSNVYSTKTSNIPTITVSSYTRKPSNQSLSGML
ncbi:hypothetical protein ACJMK2_034268 [Sinanodonta woodiana]|uniref:Uncharacterized protein n=1 Tax=Sinanodonta woodiana TaxID=1069815 RepID=A0ABD3WR22_SINWO